MTGSKTEDWASLVEYSEDSPSGLIWKVEIRGGANRNVVLTYPGKIAGTKAYRKSGVAMWWQLGYNNKRFRLHRVIYEICYGKIPNGLLVDHIDGNPFNNKKENLRLVTSAENSRNMKAHERGLKGQSGVYYEETNGCSYYVAHWSRSGKLHRKRFSCKKLGEAQAKDLALSHRESMIVELNQEGYGYTDRHGT